MATTTSAITITSDGIVASTQLEVHPSRGILDALHDAIDCDTVDAVPLSPTIAMWLDDTGALTKPINETATVLARAYGRTQLYFGNAVLTGGIDAEGNTLSLSQHELSTLLLTATAAADSVMQDIDYPFQNQEA